MRVTFVLPGFPRKPGGGHLVVYTYAGFLAERGHDVTVLHVPTSVARGTSRLKYLAARRLRPTWTDIDRRVKVRSFSSHRATRCPPADLMVATSVGTVDLVHRRSLERGLPAAYFIQGLETFSWPWPAVVESWRLPMRRIVVSPWLQEKLAEQGLGSDVVLNPVDEVFFEAETSADRSTDVVIALSTHPWKRIDIALEVIGQLLRTSPGIRIRTFGAEARDPRLPEPVEHVQQPSRRALAAMLAEAKVFVCVSETEGFGLPAAEALAAGTVVVSTRNGGVPSWAGSDVRLADSGDVQGLVVQVETALAEPASGAAAESRRRKVAEFSRVAGEKFESVLMDAIAVHAERT